MKIINRILTPIFAVLVFPAVIFLPMFRIVVTSSLLSSDNPVNLLDTFNIGEFISLKQIYEMYQNSLGDSEGLLSKIWAAIDEGKKQEILGMIPAKGWGIAFLVFLVLVLVIALVLVFTAAISKKPMASVIVSSVGIVATVLMNTCFNQFAKPLLEGALNLNTILGNTNQLIGALLGNAVSIDYMKLGVAYTAILMVFFLAWLISVSAHVASKNGDK